jgi:hypothetical protein
MCTFNYVGNTTSLDAAQLQLFTAWLDERVLSTNYIDNRQLTKAYGYTTIATIPLFVYTCFQCAELP